MTAFRSSSLPTDATFAAVASGTRHHRLLNSNEPPEDSEIPFIQSVISETDVRLGRLDDAAMLQNTNKLEEDRRSLLSYRTRNSAILSPLRRMPPEVLGEIFSWTLPSVCLVELGRGRFDKTDTPWVLTRVSSRWRAISLSTPSLWSRIAIDFATLDCDPSSTYPLSPVETLIQRSPKLKIHFYACPDKDFRHQIRMFELLSQHTSRWEEFSLGLTPAIVPLLPALRDRLTSLKRLWIQWNGSPEGLPTESIDCFQTARSLIDAGFTSQYQFLPISLPLHQLVRYQLDGPWGIHKDLLRLAPNLVEARVIIDFEEEPQHWLNSRDTIIDCLHLQRLFVSEPELLDHFRAPLLDHLALSVEAKSDLPQHLEAFLGRSGCPLRKLCLDGCPDALATTTILQKLPCITELSIIIYEIEASQQINNLMSTLTVSKTAGSTVVAPQLRSLCFGCQETGYIDYGAYLEMLKSRWNLMEVRALTAAALVWDYNIVGPDLATLRGLHALRRDGLDLLMIEDEGAVNELDAWACSTSWN
ncbi:hypothetical protein B0H19DRAFT_486541 [Mycena capillaripes]|nr:hypothetical protein B0H19DRAFT_486541 [Mycena capillaripes]